MLFSMPFTVLDNAAIALYSKFELNWPRPGVPGILTVFSIGNFNIELTGIECVFTRYELPKIRRGRRRGRK